MRDDIIAGGSGNRYSPGSCGDPLFDERIKELVEDWKPDHSPHLIRELINTALRLGHDPISVGDMKLFNRSLKEMRAAARLFSKYQGVKKIAIFGSARTAPEALEYQVAEQFARRMWEHGYMTITGGGDGIMGAAQKGAGRENSFGLNIRLPFEQRANETIDGDSKLLSFNYFFTRKLSFLKEAHAIALFPGGFGTMDEGFEALTLMQTGKMPVMPLVLVDKPGGKYWETWFEFVCDYLLTLGLISKDDFHLFDVYHDIEEAVADVVGFYRNYHSSRWVGDRFVIRIQRKLSAFSLRSLSVEFSDLLVEGGIEQGTALPEESGETSIAELPRLILHPHRRNFGRFRLLIDRINTSPA